MEATGWFQNEDFIDMHYEIARRFVELSYEGDPEGTRALFELAGDQIIEETLSELIDEGTLEMWGVDEEGDILFGLTEEGNRIADEYEARNQ